MGAAAVLAACAFPCGNLTQAQTAEALLDKLVEKGVLTVNEADALRKDSAQEFNQAYQLKSGLPGWVTAMSWGGDFRGRFEGFYADNPSAVDRNRLQYRLRLGLKVQLIERMEIGVRLASIGDTAGNQISSNQTLDNNASKKGLALDQVYAAWKAIQSPEWEGVITVGKMANPLNVGAIVMDKDYTPEGFGQQLKWHAAPGHDLGLNLGQFVITENGGNSRDAYLVAGQLEWHAKWNDRWSSGLGFGALAITGTGSLTGANGQLDVGEGNTRVTEPEGVPAHDFNPLFTRAELGYTLEQFPGYPGRFPIKLKGEYLNNPAAPSDNEGYSVSLTLGKAAKRRTWQIGYEFRRLEADAIYEELPESDFSAFSQAPRIAGGRVGFLNGTNIKGHILKAGFAPFDSLSLWMTLWLTENISAHPAGSNSEAARLQLDAIWNF